MTQDAPPIVQGNQSRVMPHIRTALSPDKQYSCHILPGPAATIVRDHVLPQMFLQRCVEVKKTQTIGLRQYAQKNHVSLNPRARFDWTNRQVSWLPVIASKRLPRLASRVASCLETHGYSGGTAQDLHLIPFILGRVPVSNSIKLSIVYQIKKFSANLLFNQIVSRHFRFY